MQEREEATLQQLIEKLAQEAGLPLKPELAEKLALHWQLLTEANRQFNLTAITDPETAAQKHYLDCLQAAAAVRSWLPQSGQVADIGSGGGFPGLVWAAAYPELSFTLIESSQKKSSGYAAAQTSPGKPPPLPISRCV